MSESIDISSTVAYEERRVSPRRTRTFTEWMNMFLVPLMVVTTILPETIFKPLQFASELLLLGTLALLVFRKPMQKQDLTLLLVFLFAQTGSLFVNSLATWMLNAKLLGIAVFAIIYFRRSATESRTLHIVFCVCIAIILIQRVTGSFPLPVGQYLSTMANELHSRPLGLFLNYHISTFFVAIYLIGYTIRRKIFPIDYILIYSTSVTTSLFSYFGQKAFVFMQPIIKLRTLKNQLIFLASILIVVSVSFQLLLALMEKYNISSNSGLVVLYQIVDPQTYIRMLSVFPADIAAFYDNTVIDYRGLGIEGFGLHSNEMFLVTMFVQSGFFLGLAFLIYLLKALPSFRIFILLSLLHYSYLLNPLAIYAACMFENRYRQNE